jgi:SecDF, P1 head subdomain
VLLAAAGGVVASLSSSHPQQVTTAGGGTAGSPGSKPFLDFRPVDCIIPNYYKPPPELTVPSAESICSDPNAAWVPTTSPSADSPAATVILPYYDGSVRYVLGPADLNQAAIANTSIIAPSAGGGYEVQFTFTRTGAAAFNAITAQRFPHYEQDPINPPYSSMEAVELDGVVQSAPTVQAPSFNGTAVISGSSSAPFTEKQAKDLAQLVALANH